VGEKLHFIYSPLPLVSEYQFDSPFDHAPMEKELLLSTCNPCADPNLAAGGVGAGAGEQHRRGHDLRAHWIG